MDGTVDEILDQMEELRSLCSGPVEMEEARVRFLFLPDLVLPNGKKVDGLLRPQPAAADGYPTRLFLSEVVPNRGANWTQHQILDRTWHSWSWKDVPPNQRLVQILVNHLRALR